LEALAAGVPVVASQVGGLCDILTHNQTALLVPPRNVEALIQALQQLLESVELRNRLQKDGLGRVHTFFSREAIVTQVEQLYTETLRT
ncbi:MAG TPA: glycosyltransferase, partial [Acidobacteriota bacterium]|nr:glycosyltransferase [Acidobacteriota bacterium]